MTRRTRTVLKWVALAVLAAAAVAIVARVVTSRAPAAVRYDTVAVDRGPIAAKVNANGTLSALVTVQVGSQVSGRIESLMADFNSPVKKGQVVAKIDPSLFEAAVAQAKANYVAALASLDKAKAQQVDAGRQYVRAEQLFKEGLMSKADRDTAESNAGVAEAQISAARAQIAQAKASLDQAKQNLDYTTIISPIDGVVISRNVDMGQTVAASFQAPILFTIAQDLGHMQVDTNVAEGDVGKIRSGLDVTFTVDAYPSRVFHGTVRQVRDNPQTVQNVVTYDAVIDVDNPDHALKPGMTANVTFVYATRDAALRVVNAAFRFHPDGPTLTAMSKDGVRPKVPNIGEARGERVVWVRSGEAAEPRVVKIGITDGTVTEVLGGLQPGDAAVTEAEAKAK